jgi:conjugal transfer pilus assembly protein TraF
MMGGRSLMKMFYSGFTICNIHCNNKPQHCKCCCKPQKSNKGFHKLFNKLAILDRITIIKTNKITSRATNIQLLNMEVKLLYNHAENGANKANAIVKSSLYTPISSLILSLVIKVKHLLYLVIYLSSVFVKWGLKILKYTWFVLLLNQSFASHQTHCDLNFGYHFYCNDGVEVEAEEETALQPKKQKNHKAELEQMKQELEVRKAKAVVEPNEENVKEYMVYQKKVLENSAKFADIWRRVLWKHPELDYTVKHPTNTLAKHKQIDVKREDIKSSLLSLSERYGLFFVYKSTCPYCHQYSNILKEFSTVYNIDILPITLDGVSMKEWEGNTIKDLSVLKKLGLEDISQVPATVLFDNKTKEVLPVGYGVLSISDLEDRIYVLINNGVDEGF